MKKTLICALALTAAPAFAADETGRWYFTPQGGYLWTDHDRDIGDDEAYGFSFGKHVSEAWSVELNLNRATPETAAGHRRFDAVSLDALRVFSRDSVVSPYLTLGLGSLNSDPDPGPAADDLMAQAGVGLLWHIADHFALRPEAKVRWDDTGAAGHQTDYLAMLGFQFSFGGSRPAASVLPPPPPPPPPAPEPAAAPPPPPAPPADSDGDGVLDTQDQCPGTAAGVAVDATGCERKGSITLEGVMFELNSADLLVESRPALDRVAADLRKSPRLKIELQGHTDSAGSDAYNLKLSQRRAESVTRYLVEAGVPDGQVSAQGYGESQPIADNAGAEGRAQNRRVVMKVLENPADVQVKGDGSL